MALPGTTRPEASQENLASNYDLEDVREIFFGGCLGDIWAGYCNEASVSKVGCWLTLAYHQYTGIPPVYWHTRPLITKASSVCSRLQILPGRTPSLFVCKEEKGWEKLDTRGNWRKSLAYRTDVQRGARNAGCKLSGATAGVTHLFINKKTTQGRVIPAPVRGLVLRIIRTAPSLEVTDNSKSLPLTKMGRGGRLESLLFSARYDGWWCAGRKKPGVGSGELGWVACWCGGLEGSRRDAGR